MDVVSVFGSGRTYPSPAEILRQSDASRSYTNDKMKGTHNG